jgi:hypothetical protein
MRDIALRASDNEVLGRSVSEGLVLLTGENDFRDPSFGETRAAGEVLTIRFARFEREIGPFAVGSPSASASCGASWSGTRRSSKRTGRGSHRFLRRR